MSNDKPKEIIIAPISGTRLINQLAALVNVCEYDYKPDIILSASGGAVTTSLAAVSNFDLSSFKRNVQELNSGEFISSWIPECLAFVPSWIVGFFQGSLYRHSRTYHAMFRKLAVPVTLKEYEVWVMAYNLDEKKPALFCSTSEEKAFLKECFENCSIIRSDIFQYLNGNVDTFADAVIASSSIPTVVPPLCIKDKLYEDGGVVYASPFTPFRDQIEDLESFHLMYINGIDLNDQDFTVVDPQQRTIFNTVDVTASAIVKSYLMQDRYSCYILIKSKGPVTKMDITLEDYFANKHKWQYSLLEMYPDRYDEIDITDFTGEDLYIKMMEQREFIGCRVWFVPKRDL